MSPLISFLFFFSIFLAPFILTHAQKIVIVDDTSSQIAYSTPNGQNWIFHTNLASVWGLYNNSDTFTNIQNASAYFEFNGSTIEYWGNSGPEHGRCRIHVDGIDQGLVNAFAQVYGPSILLYQQINLATDQSHSISVTVADGIFPNYCEVDRFQYAAIPPSSISNNNTPNTGVIVGGAIGGALALIGLFLAGFFFWRRHSQQSNSPPSPLDLTDTRARPFSGSFVTTSPDHLPSPTWNPSSVSGPIPSHASQQPGHTRRESRRSFQGPLAVQNVAFSEEVGGLAPSDLKRMEVEAEGRRRSQIVGSSLRESKSNVPDQAPIERGRPERGRPPMSPPPPTYTPSWAG